VADYTHSYTTDATPAEVLDLAEAYLVGLRGFSVPLGHDPRETRPSSPCEAVSWRCCLAAILP